MREQQSHLEKGGRKIEQRQQEDRKSQYSHLRNMAMFDITAVKKVGGVIIVFSEIIRPNGDRGRWRTQLPGQGFSTSWSSPTSQCHMNN